MCVYPHRPGAPFARFVLRRVLQHRWDTNYFRYPGDYVGGTDYIVPRNLRAVGQNCTRRMLDESFCHSNALRLRGDEFFQSSCER